MELLKIKTILVDDESRALTRMKIVLNNFPEIEVVASIENAEKAMEQILDIEPDLIFLDIEMPGKTGLEIAEEIHKNNLDSKIVFTTSYEHYAIKAIKTEAFDYLLKPIGMDELKNTIDRYKAKIHSNLSKRENQIIRLVAKGMNSREIGDKLSISPHTVDTHRRKILEKTDCKNAVELTLYAVKNHLI